MKPSEVQSEQAAATARKGMYEAYNVGRKGLATQHERANEMLSGGEPAWQKEAFSLERGAMTDAMAMKALKQNAIADTGMPILQQGGNFGLSLTPQDFGMQIAENLMGSRTSEAMTGIDQNMKAMQMLLGQGTAAGSFGLGMEQERMRSIQMLPDYNPTYAAILGMANVAGSVYGGFNQPRPGGAPTNSGWGGTAGFGV